MIPNRFMSACILIFQLRIPNLNEQAINAAVFLLFNFRNILIRIESTVRLLENIFSPISIFVNPSAIMFKIISSLGLKTITGRAETGMLCMFKCTQYLPVYIF